MGRKTSPTAVKTKLTKNLDDSKPTTVTGTSKEVGLASTSRYHVSTKVPSEELQWVEIILGKK